MPLYQTDPEKILFIDIETVSRYHSFEEMDEDWQILWDEKSRYARGEEISPAEFYPQRAGIMAEFGKVICISCAFLTRQAGRRQLRVRSFAGNDERKLLADFAELLDQHFRQHLLCAHNGKEFDFPYLSRRMLINGVKLPPALNTSGSKPWEIPHLDTMEMWKFGDRKNYTSLKLLSALFDIPTPKDDIDGSMVGKVYWVDKDLPRIVAYCQKDTISLARLYLKLEMEGDLSDEDIIIADKYV
jgi:DNA polymerase elongation subunit (family B)